MGKPLRATAKFPSSGRSNREKPPPRAMKAVKTLRHSWSIRLRRTTEMMISLSSLSLPTQRPGALLIKTIPILQQDRLKKPGVKSRPVQAALFGRRSKSNRDRTWKTAYPIAILSKVLIHSGPLHGIFTENNIAQTILALMSNCRFPALPSPASMFGAT